ncbi:hypothetical protein PN498_10150 [Oscillatoria sp. CS-180]|uniref:hypothetical protein n=1 Tax=Oscillatoria sp. CS-180 TaxID=3021720 RepID=UPI00232DC6F2|nr:hypothetical protein [Oscillatoria sp. CS-180]MDB9526348.1 hypothetical protein [Oscillatoria sp. CS-180]
MKFWQKGVVGVGIFTVIAIGAGVAKTYAKYSDHNLAAIDLMNEPVSGQLVYTGEAINFVQAEEGSNIYDISFDLEGDGYNETLKLQNIDLDLFIPAVPEHVQGDDQLVRWFLSEREFNRQRAVFSAGSEHIYAPDGFAGYDSDQLVISLTNNCLGAGHWELAVSVVEEDGSTRKVYQGFFGFPMGTYAQMVRDRNPDVSYLLHARSMEPWIGFRFLRGSTFDIDRLRTVVSDTRVEGSDRADAAVLVRNEQADKADLVVYDGAPWENYAELRQSSVKFQSFVAPGIYTDQRLWGSNLSEIATLDHAIARKIESPLSDKELTEIELVMLNNEGVPRRLIVSGIDLEQVPQLPIENYSDGVYRPMGFGTPFTQDYEELKQQPPESVPFFSVLLDENDKIINYRMDVGINGLVLHRDEADPSVLHLYLMAYERILLVGHYVIDVDKEASTTAQTTVDTAM